MMETQMILREALQTPIGAKLKFSQFGFIPSQNAKEWIKIPNYHFKTKEKVIWDQNLFRMVIFRWKRRIF